MVGEGWGLGRDSRGLHEKGVGAMRVEDRSRISVREAKLRMWVEGWEGKGVVRGQRRERASPPGSDSRPRLATIMIPFLPPRGPIQESRPGGGG
eukprot:2816290-Rhodomonas_salina.3